MNRFLAPCRSLFYIQFNAIPIQPDHSAPTGRSFHPRHGPLQNMIMLRVLRVRPEHAQPADLLAQPRLHLDLRARLREDALPELLPALGRVAVHPGALGRAPFALHGAPALHPEEHRPGERREEAGEEARDVLLAVELEQVEEGAREDG